MKGFCEPDEICVDGPKDALGEPTVANCIGQGRFKAVPNYASAEGGRYMEDFLKGRRASAVVSREDKKTALRVKRLEIDAGVAAGGGKVGGQQAGLMSREKCANCVGVATGELEEGTDFLSAEVMVGGTAAAAAAAGGVLWLAVLSG